MAIDGIDDVLVVGAGPAGSATAARLAARGYRVRVLDRADFPRDKACSEYLSPETLRQLDLLGVLEQVDAAGGAPVAGTTVSGPAGSRLAGRFARAGGTPLRPTGLGLARQQLDAILVDAARRRGAMVETNIVVRDLLRDASGAIEGVTATNAEGGATTYRARVVVGADGLRSVVARRAGLHRRGRLRRVAFTAHVAGVAGLHDMTELHVGRDGYVGINPIGEAKERRREGEKEGRREGGKESKESKERMWEGGVANVAVVVPASLAEAARGDPVEFFRRRIEATPAVAGRIDLARTVRPIMATGPFDAMSRRSTADGALLVGDAADFFDPFTGEGICTALRGAALAAEAIDDALAQPGPVTARRLHGYRIARRRAFLGKWIIERVIGYAMLAPTFFDRCVNRLERRELADTLIGVTGQFVSPAKILNPVAMAKVLL
ncbi:MAG: NAD(P)/FAD-dependent oxidoreductase [Gemmatimonadales bacterium]